MAPMSVSVFCGDGSNVGQRFLWILAECGIDSIVKILAHVNYELIAHDVNLCSRLQPQPKPIGEESE